MDEKEEFEVWIAPADDYVDLNDAPYIVTELVRLACKVVTEGEIISIPLGYNSNVFQNYPSLKKREKPAGLHIYSQHANYKKFKTDPDKFLHGELKLKIVKTKPEKKVVINYYTRILITDMVKK